MGFKAFMTFKYEPPASNALVFSTAKEAEDYGNDLLYRWTRPTGIEVREVPDAPTHRWYDEERKLVRIEDGTSHVPAYRVQL